MEGALTDSYYADIGHPKLFEVAAELRAGGEDPVGIATRTFTFVRDGFPFGYDIY